MNLRSAATIALSSCTLSALADEASVVWQDSPWFAERVATLSAEPDVRLHVNQPTDADDRPATRLILFALPNGNTLEQTLGCQASPERHWRYDIQHVAAQVRLLRSLLTRERIVLVAAEAAGLSWPAWRRDHENANARIAELVAEWRVRFAAPDALVTLAAHSGGGSFLWGVVEAGEVPDWVDRIAFLDANYSFDAATHTEKFRRWLDADPSRELVVVAYDDREITLDGKKVVSDTGGTYRATHRMIDAFAEFRPFHGLGFSPFEGVRGSGFAFYIHPNPENKILHTVLVGEMNGLAHAQLIGQEPEGWLGLSRPRAYKDWVQPTPYGESE